MQSDDVVGMRRQVVTGGVFCIAMILVHCAHGLTEAEMEKAAEVFNRDCPEFNPGEKPSTLPDGSNIYCDECSCKRYCGSGIMCCYTDQDSRYKYLTTGTLGCLYTHTAPMFLHSVVYSPRYFMVSGYDHEAGVGENEAGNEVGDGESEAAERCVDRSSGEAVLCGNQIAAAWGSLFPVFSPSTGKLYKNKKCATCNGVHDAIQFKTNIKCENVTLEELTNALLLVTPWPDECKMYFFKPDSVSEESLQKHECFNDVEEVCMGEVLRKPKGLTRKHVTQYCQNYTATPYKNRHSTVFAKSACNICTGSEDPDFLSNKCSSMVSTSNKRNFLILLQSSIELPTQYDAKPKGNVPQACQPVDREKEQVADSSQCRMVQCPTGQFRNLTSGRCFHPSSYWLGDAYAILLKLTPAVTLSTRGIITSSVELDISRVTSPWPDPWIIAQFLYSPEIGADNSSHSDQGNVTANTTEQIAYFIARVMHPKAYVQPESFVADLFVNIYSMWNFTKLDGVEVEMKPYLLGYEIKNTYSSDRNVSYIPEWLDPMVTGENIPAHLHYTQLYHAPKRSFIRIPEESTRYIHKSFFCDQIQLEEGEFILNETQALLVYTPSNTTFYRYEFTDLKDHSGNDVPRICLSDSLLILAVETSGNASHSEPVSLAVVVVTAIALASLVTRS